MVIIEVEKPLSHAFVFVTAESLEWSNDVR